MNPIIDGQVHHFDARGLYDGLSMLWDEESGSWWNHVTGYAVHGPLRGERLETSNVLHSTVSQTLSNFPGALVAISGTAPQRRRPYTGVLGRLGARLSGFFKGTMGSADDRVEEMDVGLGIWTEDEKRYYSMNTVTEQGKFVIDQFGGRSIAVYFDPTAHAMAATYTNATSGRWDGDDLVLDDGTIIRNGLLVDGSGERLETERPMQLFTRWYGFALAFPETEVFEP